MKKRNIIIHFLLLLVLIATFAACLMTISPANAVADEIILANGDRLTGTVVKAEGGKMIIKTEYAEAIAIPLDKIKMIMTDNPVEVHLIGGEILKGKLKIMEDGNLVIEPSPERAVSRVDMSKVSAINPPPKPPAKLTGNVSLGGGLQTGNTDRRNFAAAIDASIRGDRDRFGVRFMFNYADEKGEVTTRNYFGALKYDYFFTQKLYGYLGLDMLKDRFKDLDLRTIIGPGAGY